MYNIQDKALKLAKQYFSGYSYHGLSIEDGKEIHNLLLSVKENDTESKTVFPDFISDLGFIEHFHVTSGTQYKNGGYANISEHKKLERKADDFIKQSNCSSCSFEYNHYNDNLTNFNNSFKSCWRKHIRSLNKYKGKKHISCFLISFDDFIKVHIKPDEFGLFYGDLFLDRPNFCLFYNKELLNFMLNYSHLIDYVIFINIGIVDKNYCCEVIKLCNIPNLLNILRVNYEMYAPNITDIISVNKIL